MGRDLIQNKLRSDSLAHLTAKHIFETRWVYGESQTPPECAIGERGKGNRVDADQTYKMELPDLMEELMCRDNLTASISPHT